MQILPALTVLSMTCKGSTAFPKYAFIHYHDILSCLFPSLIAFLSFLFVPFVLFSPARNVGGGSAVDHRWSKTVFPTSKPKNGLLISFFWCKLKKKH